MTREEALFKLHEKTAAGRPVVAVSAGTGLVAQAAERAGADLIMVYNSGWFRSHGAPSLAGLMPYGDANSIVMDMGTMIAPARRSVPVIAGVCATDPFRSIPTFLREIQDAGYKGVQNFPSVALIDGRLRADLEATGIEFHHEVEMIATAHELGLLTCAFAAQPEEAATMVQAGADIVVPHLGVTRFGTSLDEAIDRVQAIRDAAAALAPDVIVLFHGGPATGPSAIQEMFDSTVGVAGYLAASNVERAPVERAVEFAVQELVSLNIVPEGSKATPLEPNEYLNVHNAREYLVRNGLVVPSADVRIEPLGGGISNTLLLYSVGDDRGVVKQSRPRIDVEQEWMCDVRRTLIEIDAITEFSRILPAGTVPTILFSDRDNYVLVMEAAPPDTNLWKQALLAGNVDPNVASSAGSILAMIHRETADDQRLRKCFSVAPLYQLRIEPYYMATAAHHPQLKRCFQTAANDLVTIRKSLIHGDFVPKNMIVLGNARILLLDFEITHYGNPAYDVATFVNHLLLKAIVFPRRAAQFASAIGAFMDAYAAGAGHVAPDEDETLLQLGCLMLARVDGKSPVEYLASDHAKGTVREFAYDILVGEVASLSGAVDRSMGTHGTFDRTVAEEEV